MQNGLARNQARMDRVKPMAERLFPTAFEQHDNKLDLIVMIYDSTGALVRSGRETRPARAPGEMLRDREVLKFVMPEVAIETFSEWTLADISSVAQQRGNGGVVVMFAFIGKAPW